MEVVGEEELFGFEVRLEASMKIEMIAGEIGEHRRAETQAAQSLLHQGVGGGFKCGVSDAFVDHFFEQRLQVE